MRTFLATLAFVLIGSVASAACGKDTVWLRGDWGQIRFSIELADTPEERARGLMFRDAMPGQHGMLFVYEAPQSAVFWMKNTLIPLDMIFVDRTGVVKHVHHRAIPGDLTPIDGGRDVYAVLEINGGLAQRYGISVGTELRHQVFSDGPAKWEC